MDLLLVNQELVESKLYRSNRAFTNLNGRDIADLLYLHTIMVFMLAQDRGQAKYGLEYAEETTQYGGYAIFRTSATDLYLLAYTTAHPDTKNIRLHDAYESKKFLSFLNFDSKAHWRFIRDLSRDDVSDIRASSYFTRLESQLKIKDSRYKRWRRVIIDWHNKSDSTRRSTAAEIRRELKRLASYGELLIPMSALAQYEPAKDTYVALDKPSFGDKITGAAIGAVAGRVVAAKIADKTGGDKAKMKQIGTGLGAIAGYWNAGRSRKQS